MSLSTKVIETPRPQLERPGRPLIRTVMTFVTPAMATEWLSNNNEGNRKVRSGEVELIATQILQGKYEPTHQGIGFYDDGTLADGQHRLMAVVEAGEGIWVNVTTGLSKNVVHKIDKGIVRTSLDSLHFLGMKSDNKRVAVCQCMIYQYRTELERRESWAIEKCTSEQFSRYYEKFSQAIEWTLGFGAASKYPAPVQAAVATAWFAEDRDRLGEFMLVMESGEMFSDDDRAAIRLRDYLKDKRYGQGSTARNDLFLRCCASLRYFLARRNLAKLYATSEHAFKFVSHVGEV